MVISRLKSWLQKLSAATLFLFFLSWGSSSEIKDELSFVLEANLLSGEKKGEDADSDFQETSEIRLVGIVFIRLYQRFISSQDMPVCNFTPSCSQFALKAIQRYGIIKGVLMASDRLQRCNGFTRMSRYYSLDPMTGKAIDPVENYCFKREVK